MTVQLTSLVGSSTPFLLAYAVPLLLLSILITFAGTFLTLDRTRTFAPHSDVAHPLLGSFIKSHSAEQKAWSFRLGGGLGGIAIGYVFGIHITTFFSLLIMNKSSASALTPSTFLVVWIASVIPTTILGARWKVSALVFIGITAGINLSLALCVISHPSLASRVVLSSVITSLMVISVLVPSLIPPFQNFFHTITRVATSCAGAFFMTMSIALLTRSSAFYSWANAWDRLWVSDESGWGMSGEKGFDALFCALWVCGAVGDWSLYQLIGVDPDEKWDACLAEYTSTLPNAHNRAGRFQPLPSWWERFLTAAHLSSPGLERSHDIITHSDAELQLKSSDASTMDTVFGEKLAAHLSKEELQMAISPIAYDWDPPRPEKGFGFLRKGRNQKRPIYKPVFNQGISSSEAERSVFDLARRPTCLQKAKIARLHQRQQRIAKERGRRPVEFRPADDLSSDSDEDTLSKEDELRTPLCTSLKDVAVRASPMAHMNSSATSLSGTTVRPSTDSARDGSETLEAFDIREEMLRLAALKASFGLGGRVTPTSDAPDWKPGFIKRATSSSGAPDPPAQKPRAIRAATTPSPGALPLTPSLVNAFERLAKAQVEAHGGGNAVVQNPHQYLPSHRERVSGNMSGSEPVSGLPVTSDSPKPTGRNTSGNRYAF
ncbi:hypothetical protein M0805_008572 [Coniferiporia weirii]|nr:hypothetical protein M0805_008572 [Coniferiporia weirii]